ncbi:hypothetical protein [Streptomyces sp. NBC_01408]|uniref:hypothetical protein n=1 Tax=Streptomyces sp. NBC_01408 TaxID=2903855 RepID=UPI00225BBDCC|nr:hypothetical protein [Streptomyces sp. NBC_01408]MCX4691948.1 hypothetical protein [Streptomyces sp. NBC_01408]
MSTPEEQQQQQQQYQQQHEQHPQQHQEDPYGTQTWQSDTWETGYQPVHPPLGAVPGQPVAPEGWFRDEAPAPAPGQTPDPAPASAEETAYLPPYPGPGQQQGIAPDGWFRDEVQAPAPAPVQDWSQAAETAYLPPYQEHAAQAPAPVPAEETAYLPPYQEHAAQAQAPASAEETAYLPPYPGPGEQQGIAPDGWFRDEVQAPAPAPGQDWSQGGAPWPDFAAAEQTAYLPPQQAAPVQAQTQAPAPASASAEETAYLPPYPGPEAVAAVAAGPGAGVAGQDPVPGEEPAWSPPTLAGNTIRAVDPAQARAEGLSPIIDPGPQSAVLTAALGLLLAVAAALGEFALLVPLIALQGLTAAGWFRLNGMWPARQGIALAFLGALVADAAVLAVEPAYGPGAIIGTLGAWVLLTLVLQLRSHADPDERMYGLMASVASAALAIVCAGYLAAGSEAVTVGGVAVAAAVFARALPLPAAPSVGVSLASAAGAGIAVGGLTVGAGGGALLGLVAGVCALIGLRVAAYDYPSKFVHMTAGVALPLAAAAPAVYLIGRVVG